ncbi:MAG TPA: L,D-transpeptidase [Thermoleophilaceae bacterium]|nr:L,D-transpeptidase [Thermoleophilaceae bacterium]
MRRSTRLLAIALPVALATVPVALAGADSAAGDRDSGAVPVAHDPLVDPEAATSIAAAASTKAAASVAAEALAKATRPPPAAIVAVAPGRTVVLRVRPGGPVALRVGDTTEFGSRQRLGVVRRAGRWLGVTTPELPNGTLGWLERRSPAVEVRRTNWSIVADVSRRTVVLRRAGKPVRRLSVAVGRPGSPTPTGRFAVTDKLSGGDYGSYYGCCILALSATQPNTPPGWTGGDRMAIHGTSDPGSIGAAASAGCLRAADGDLEYLMGRAPLGTPVVIRR